MSALSRLRCAGLSVRLDGGEVVVEGLDRLSPEMAGSLLTLAKACREGLRLELLAGPVPYDAETLARFRESHGHLICCPATRPAWNWRLRECCETNCKTPCDIGEREI